MNHNCPNHEKLEHVMAQVAHDIRSPIALLSSLVHHAHEMSDETRMMLRCALNRIRDITGTLLEKPKTSLVPLPVFPLIESAVQQMRMQFSNKNQIKIIINNFSGPDICAVFHPSDLERVLSNLLNNAFDALGDFGQVLVKIRSAGDKVFLEISDNGKGIPEEILPRLCQRRVTHEKVGGSGLGLYHARITVESWGGTLDLKSIQGTGTTVTLTLLSGFLR